MKKILPMTKAQSDTLFAKWRRQSQVRDFDVFIDQAYVAFVNGAIAIRIGSITVCIEPDGHAHT
tara:strand:+ start:796 stop:987 length:192 start_codon:yes stop_codon:yes gene_type:complete